MSQFEEIPSPGCGFQGSRVWEIPRASACKTLGISSKQAGNEAFQVPGSPSNLALLEEVITTAFIFTT